jgi:hypothetical protein
MMCFLTFHGVKNVGRSLLSRFYGLAFLTMTFRHFASVECAQTKILEIFPGRTIVNTAARARMDACELIFHLAHAWLPSIFRDVLFHLMKKVACKKNILPFCRSWVDEAGWLHVQFKISIFFFSRTTGKLGFFIFLQVWLCLPGFEYCTLGDLQRNQKQRTNRS